MRMARSGQIRGRVNDEQLLSLLDQVAQAESGGASGGGSSRSKITVSGGIRINIIAGDVNQLRCHEGRSENIVQADSCVPSSLCYRCNGDKTSSFPTTKTMMMTSCQAAVGRKRAEQTARKQMQRRMMTTMTFLTCDTSWQYCQAVLKQSPLLVVASCNEIHVIWRIRARQAFFPGRFRRSFQQQSRLL